MVVVTCVAVDDVEIMYLVEMMLGGIGRVDTRDARVESAAENGGEAGLTEALVISPLPFVFELGFVFGFVIGCVKVRYAGFEAGVHDWQVLIGQGHIDYKVGLDLVDEFDQFRHAVGIDLRCLDAVAANGLSHSVAFAFGAAGKRDLSENVGLASHFVSHHGSNAACSNLKNFTHFLCG